ncbi:IclR family transcriptional regulator C-terminal domain-containing protein [Mesorhizobium sp. BAC0120]|uniref:IclR family transcriptional regulator domain-containing protein n=1 Tax=Mesorhizobium sp. BAC0120 TaxID=3090670 RepID=UPI00298CDCCE|nr:IclR family transcriptional regulator C-terminal domain-containing protein [Mesorhizobium sp. BAC0120]MDW6025773.1 IclR family transcriptional regulator C-terminal domain-containing protein [Mesorhizobium sp. BAC0120]
MTEQPPRDLVGSLAKGLDVMAILATRPAGMTLTEMAQEAGLTRAGARRFLLTLVASGYAAQDGRRFALTPRLLGLARQWLDGSSLWGFAEPHMRKVAVALKESCSAAVLSDQDVVYVARVPGERIMSVALHVGTRLPAYCTSMGRVLLSELPEPQLRQFLADAQIRKLTQNTATDRERLFDIIRDVAVDGYALVDEELEIGLRSIAVPIRDRSARIVAAVNVSTQPSRFTVAAMKREILPLLQRAAGDIESFFAV